MFFSSRPRIFEVAMQEGEDKRCRLLSKEVVLLVFLAFIAYIPALGNGFVFDDTIHVVENPSIRSSSGVLGGFISPLFPGDLYRPLFSTSLALTYYFVKLEPFWYHLTNNLLHSVNVALLFWILTPIVGRRVALVSMCIFAVHPLHTEAVANVTGRSELLAHAFGLGFLVMVQRALVIESGRSSIFHKASIALLLLGALLTKESALVYVLLASLFLPFGVVQGANLKKWMPLALTVSLVVMVYFLLRWIALGDRFLGGVESVFLDNPLQALPWYGRVVSAVSLLGRYLTMIAAPVYLSADYSFNALVPLSVEVAFTGVVLLFVSVGYFFVGLDRFRKGKAEGFLLLWFFASFAVTSNVLIPIGTIFGERLAYLPSAGFICYLVKVAEQWRPKSWYYGVLCSGFTLVTALHISVWHSNEDLFLYQLRFSGQSAKTLNNLASVLQKKGLNVEARELFKRAAMIAPFFDRPRLALARMYIAEGRISKAEEELNSLLELRPRNVDALSILGTLHLNQGRLEEARKLFGEVLHLLPSHMQARVGLLGIAVAERDVRLSLKFYRELGPEADDDLNFKKLEALLIKTLGFKEPGNQLTY